MAALLQPGDTLGKYEIVRELALGGMAAIYLAKVHGTAGFEKNVVLKCILPSFVGDRTLVTMFLDEARLAATLRHSNIADVFDVGNEGKHYYFAMEYVHGENARQVRLQAKQKSLPIPLEVSLATVLGTAAALAYAHDKLAPDGTPLDIVHRDVSPSNILVSFEGAIKLVDFGVARASQRSGAKTRTGMRKGKVPYMSPEQCRGKTVDRRSDLFALGTVLYELTAGQRPFLGNSDFEVMDAIVTGTPQPPSALVPDYPRDLEQIVMRMLAKAPDARYPDAHALLEHLHTFAARNGVLTSAHIVARYMSELFSEQPISDRDTYTDFGKVPPPPLPEDAPTDSFKRGEQLWAPAQNVKIRTPKSATDASTLIAAEDLSVTTPFAELTNHDVVLPFDPIDARSAEILDQLDADAPPDGETDDARAYRRVETLIHMAMGWLGIGDADKAVTAITLALDEDTTSDLVQELFQRHVDTIVSVYEAMLEDPYRVPTLTRTPDELDEVVVDPDTRDLLGWIDGVANIKEIIERSGMQRLEAYHHLCQLMLRGILT